MLRCLQWALICLLFFFFLNLPHIIYIHILTLLCKILGSIASKSSPSSGGSYSWTLPGCSCPLNKVTLLTWKNKKTLRATFLRPVLLKPAGRPFPRSANFHLPSSTSDFTRTLASSSFQSTAVSHHQAFLEESALTSFEVKFAACLSSLDHMIFKRFTTWDSRTNIWTYMSTLPATSNVLNVVYSWEDHSFKSPEKSQWSVIRDGRNSPCFSAEKKKLNYPFFLFHKRRCSPLCTAGDDTCACVPKPGVSSSQLNPGLVSAEQLEWF